MITMAIVAIGLATAVPAFKTYLWNLRIKTAMDNLVTDLHLGRARAISRNVQTVICPSLDGQFCSVDFQWQNGWILFGDQNTDRTRQPEEPILKIAGATDFLNIASSRGRTYLRFFPNGSAPGSNISISFCDNRGAAHAGKVVVSNSGRVRKELKGISPTEACP